MSKKTAKEATKVSLGMATSRRCDCKYPYQDALYGYGYRVKNVTKNGYRCTVCGTSEVVK